MSREARRPSASVREAVGRALVVALMASACATPVAPIGGEAGSFAPDADERALWARSAREAAAIAERVRPYDDPELTAYLAALAGGLMPGFARAAGAPPSRVSVVRDPTLNAFAWPDGRLLVHTGLLAAVESEAQLALILAREVAHVVRRHALVASRRGLAAPEPDVDTVPLSGTAAAILGGRATLATLAAITGYGEPSESEADADAVGALAAGGWDVQHATSVYEVLGGNAVERGDVEIFLLGAPARAQARGDSLAVLTESVAAGGRVTSEVFEALRLRVSRDNAVEDARLGRFTLARRQLDRALGATPTDAATHLYLGDLHRLQAQRAGSDPERAAETEAAARDYARALALDPARADVHRQLGLLYFQEQDPVRALAELREYLRRAPDAPDAARIGEYVRELER